MRKDPRLIAFHTKLRGKNKTLAATVNNAKIQVVAGSVVIFACTSADMFGRMTGRKEIGQIKAAVYSAYGIDQIRIMQKDKGYETTSMPGYAKLVYTNSQSQDM